MTNKENPPSPPLLAGVAAAFRWNPALKDLYERLPKRSKPHTLALVASARKLLVFANAVLAYGAPLDRKTGRCLMVATPRSAVKPRRCRYRFRSRAMVVISSVVRNAVAEAL